MKLTLSSLTVLLLASSCLVLAEPEAHDDDHDSNNMATPTGTTTPTETSVDWDKVKAAPWAGGHMHGVPILETELTLGQQKYWSSYNTTTYLSIDTPYKSHIHAHLLLLFISAFILYPFVLVLNNLESNWFLPLLVFQASLTLVSCLLYSIFINNVPDLYPHMAYTKMVTGLFVFTLLQVSFAVVFSVKRWLYSNPQTSSEHMTTSIGSFQARTTLNPFTDDAFVSYATALKGKAENIQLDDIRSPLSTEFEDENTDVDSSNLEENFISSIDSVNQTHTLASTLRLTQSRNSLLATLSSSIVISNLASSFGTLFTVLHNVATWALLAYFFALFPTAFACLNLLGRGKKIFNLLAHFIKGGIFFILGLLSLARYCGCFSGVGGAWNYAYVELEQYAQKNTSQATVSESDRIMTGMSGKGSGGSYVSHSIWIKLHQLMIPHDYITRCGGLLCSFEFVESFLIFLYGASNMFLERLGATDEAWRAKDLQHVSIAFLYFGAGLCGLICESKLFSWRRALFFNVAGRQLANTENIKIDNDTAVDDQHKVLGSQKLFTPGFSPNPFPVFTIFWTGILMSKHVQSSTLSTEIHVQWGSLLTYGSFFRVITFILMSYYPLRGSKECFVPSKPWSELVTSFCLLCGGMVFMESTDQVVEALAYRGLTPMFTINVSVGIISLIMAWVMFIFAVKDRLRAVPLSE